MVILVVGVGFLGIAKATDAPSFCGGACHEMAPYHAAWAQGPHKSVACVECHVDPGTVARLGHKFVALQEVVDHVKGAPPFPLASPPPVPDSRCVRCHASVVVKQVGFSHAEHAKRGTCVMCHATTGHVVSSAALKNAGILRVSYSSPATSSAGSIAVVDGGAANLTGHVAVHCSRCHDMAATRCSACHKAPRTVGAASTAASTSATVGTGTASAAGTSRLHPARTDCVTCHAPGAAFVFTHPSANSACESCHTPTSASHPSQTDCTTCHKAAGKSWAFTHPSASGTCSSCHARPSSHTSAGGGYECSSCHRAAGRNWAFSHPSVSSGCVSCHAAKTPANHFGTSCGSCHSPSRGWANAVFHHPAIPGGQHTYQTFACTKCHPGTGHGPGHFCSCHGNTTGPGGG